MFSNIEPTNAVVDSSISLLFLTNIIVSSLSGIISPLSNLDTSSFCKAIFCGSASFCSLRVKPNCPAPNKTKLNIINRIVVLISRYLIITLLRYLTPYLRGGVDGCTFCIKSVTGNGVPLNVLVRCFCIHLIDGQS